MRNGSVLFGRSRSAIGVCTRDDDDDDDDDDDEYDDTLNFLQLVTRKG